MYLVTLLPRLYFADIHLCNFVERVAEVVGQRGQIPQHIAYLLGDFLLCVAVAEVASLVSDNLFHLVGHLTGFARQSENGIYDGVWIDGCLQGLFLIFVHFHDFLRLLCDVIGFVRICGCRNLGDDSFIPPIRLPDRMQS